MYAPGTRVLPTTAADVKAAKDKLDPDTLAYVNRFNLVYYIGDIWWRPDTGERIEGGVPLDNKVDLWKTEETRWNAERKRLSDAMAAKGIKLSSKPGRDGVYGAYAPWAPIRADLSRTPGGTAATRAPAEVRELKIKGLTEREARCVATFGLVYYEPEVWFRPDTGEWLRTWSGYTDSSIRTSSLEDKAYTWQTERGEKWRGASPQAGLAVQSVNRHQQSASSAVLPHSRPGSNSGTTARPASPQALAKKMSQLRPREVDYIKKHDLVFSEPDEWVIPGKIYGGKFNTESLEWKAYMWKEELDRAQKREMADAREELHRAGRRERAAAQAAQAPQPGSQTPQRGRSPSSLHRRASNGSRP